MVGYDDCLLRLTMKLIWLLAGEVFITDVITGFGLSLIYFHLIEF